MALAVSDNANHIAGAIRTKLIEEGDKPKAKLIIDETAGAGSVCDVTLCELCGYGE